MILDIEGDYVEKGTSKRKADPSFWHKRRLLNGGESEQDLERRKERQKEIKKTWKNLKAAKKRSRRSEFYDRAKDQGLLPSDVMAFSLTCIGDVDSQYTCAVHVNDIVNADFDGCPEMP